MSYKNNIYLLTALCCLFISSPLMAQKPDFNFKTINQPDGLVNSTVQTIFEDSYGFIWLGTQHGVQRFDGKTFKNYEHLATDSLGLSDNYINGFCEDDDRNIWITTSDGLNKYIRKTDKIVRYKWNNNDAPELDELGYYGILKDEFDSNIIWLSDFNRGLIKLNISSNNSTIYSLNGNKGIISTWFLSYPGNKNKLLLGGSKLFSFDKKSGKFNEILKLEQNSVVPNNLINDAVLDPANKEIIWLATGDFWGRGSLGGLIRYNLRTGWKKIFKPENRSGDLPDKHLMSLSFDGNNNLWIGSRYKGVFLYNKKEDKFYNFINNEFDDESFATFNSVRSILKDKSGTIWFGTWGDGISLLSPSLQKFSHYNYLPNDNNGLLNNYVNTFAEDKEGNIWIGTQAGGLSKFNPGTLLFENYFQEFILHKKNKTSITYLYYDSFENLWVGTYDDALYRFNPKTGRKIHYKKGVSNKEVTQNRISGIAEIKKGEILISTYGGGLNIYTYTNDSFKHFVNDPDDSTSIPDNQIWLPFSDNDGNYYFSGNSVAGLIKFVPKTGKFYLTNISENITTFTMPCKTYDETVYINDVAEGLREIDLGKELTVNTIYDIDGNSIKNIVSILVDSDNNLWLGTGNGLIEYDPETKITKRYNTDDGLQGNEFNRFAALKSSTGEMYFGGKKGFSVFNPGEIKISMYEPPIVFVDFKLFQKSVELGDDSVLKENILLTNKIKLDHSQNDFSVSFAALDYSNPNKIHYKYMLENHDKEWIEVGNRNFASYTNMDPGKYIFKVLATNSDGVWLDKATTLKIIITPPWWQTTFAYISYGIIFVLGVFGVDRFQRRKLLAKARERAKIKESEMRAQIAEAENERKTKELEEARELQLSMLPEDLPNLPNLDIAVYMQTATEVGGDYYDFHVGMDGTLTVVVGDATGHGMKAGTMVTTTKSLFNILAPNPDILTTFSEISRVIKGMKFHQLSMCLMLLKIKGNELSVSSAAMPPALIYRKKNKAIEEIFMKGMPLGSMNNFPYTIKESHLETGDTILLLSDGLPELTNDNNEMYGYDRTKTEFNSVGEKEPEEIVNHLKNSVSQWVNGKAPDDDITFVVLKMK